jgi:hypothetical protein
MRIHSEEEWEKVEARGRGRYLLRYGVVGRGLPLGCVVAVVIEAALGHPLPDALGEPFFLRNLLLAVGVFSASGCVSALANWRIHQRRFGGGNRERLGPRRPAG